MARKRRIAYRKKQQNRFSMFLATLVVVMILVLVGVQSAELRDKIAAASIYSEVEGSDHCPVALDLTL